MIQNNNIVCFGEVLWDVYPNEKKLGGAPFNVAAHLKQLGSEVNIITKVGKDDLGNEIIKAIETQNISTEQLQIDEELPTGTVQVELDENGIPNYEIKEPVAWDLIQKKLTNLELVKNANALVYGTLACRTSQNFDTLNYLIKSSQLNICDLNIRQNFYSKTLIEKLLNVTHILKVNEEEEQLLIEMFDFDVKNFYKQIQSAFNLEIIIKTKGANGAEAWQDGKIDQVEGVKVNVVNTVGSGDAFLAAFLHHYLNQKNIKTCLTEAAKLGAYVATQVDAIPKHQ